MNEIEIFKKLNTITLKSLYPEGIAENETILQKIAEHKNLMRNIQHEYPSPNKEYKIGIYIRYFNQTKYENYIEYHKKQFSDTIALCPKWTLVDFYIDNGNNAPFMVKSPALAQLIQDCEDEKIDLIITQKTTNLSKSISEIMFCSRLLLRLPKPVGIYFISEDIFTLASYFRQDLLDTSFAFIPYLDYNSDKTPQISNSDMKND